MKKLDVKKLLSSSSTIRIADLGCATGPNAFFHSHYILHAIKNKFITQTTNNNNNNNNNLSNNNNNNIINFQVFFNDLPSNDFNTLFATLPPQDKRDYFACGVPGCFYGTLFPEASIHVAYSVHACHFLSESPRELAGSGAVATTNKGRVHYTGASEDVAEAYRRQFNEDARKFLEGRAMEIVSGGMLVMVMQGVPHGMPHSQVPAGFMYECMGSILKDMVNEGLLEESELDSFNVPFYTPSPKEMREVIEANGKFSIERMELSDPAPWLARSSLTDIPDWVIHVRAAMEPIFTSHFGHHITHQLFTRLPTLMQLNSQDLDSKSRDKTQMLLVLKRKDRSI
ncbi:putative S-adenosylmethionine-dependent methyltransferase At5g38100 [Senna tora]|uniref:Putative S-adenosylmethionine-dependent methyltransferase At5g38100 n=1 Tax=Senna tora TaxID=362788 RepID=A0A834W3Y4_9FABA|nr:putative S-adenosylmethionine-dependent methyltransferase At5g38100 [Senna tora]